MLIFATMAYLILNDYQQNIQTAQLNQLTGSVDSIRTGAELVAIEEAVSYLKQKYDTDAEFTDTAKWIYAQSYKAKNRVYLDATAYSASSTYALNSLVLQGGYVYICITAIGTPEAFNAAKWSSLGAQYDLFYVTLPKDEFNYKAQYVKGDQVYWKDKVYTAALDSPVYGHDAALQYQKINQLPYINVFPDDAVNGEKYWGTGTAYTVAANTLPTDTTKWTKGDNRSQKIIDCIIDLVLYKIHARIAPNNIPQLRIDNSDAAIMWLRACAKGDVTPPLTLKQPSVGRRIRYGGNVKQNNSY